MRHGAAPVFHGLCTTTAGVDARGVAGPVRAPGGIGGPGGLGVVPVVVIATVVLAGCGSTRSLVRGARYAVRGMGFPWWADVG